jgi:hypothetical protein
MQITNMKRSLMHSLNVLVLYALIQATTYAQGSEPLPPNCSEQSPGGGCAMYDVSIVELIANPAKYDGKRVRLMGYIHFEFEGNGIYLHKDDHQFSLGYNGLWVEWAARATRSSECQDTYALIEGTFRASHRGHMGLRSGAVTDMTRCMKWPPPAARR